MFSPKFKWFAAAGWMVASLAFLARPAWAEGEEEKALQGLILQLQKAHEGAHAANPNPNPNPYWIGISAEPREKGGGLVIENVIPESPAQKAGLQVGDVIKEVQGKGINQLEELVQAITQSNGKALKIVVAREGVLKPFAVIPEKSAARWRADQFREEGNERGGLRILLKEGKEEQDGDDDDNEDEDWDDEDEDEGDDDDDDEHRGLKRSGTFQFRVPEAKGGVQFQIHPGHPGGTMGGMMLHGPGGFAGPAHHAAHAGGLPDDMEVTITKRGSKPAVITVTQGVKMWQTDETEMHILPPQALAYASRSLGKTHTMLGISSGGRTGGMMLPAAGAVREFRIEEGSGWVPAQKTPEAKKPAEKKPEAKNPEKKPEARKTEEKKPEAKKSEERKSEEKKPASKKPDEKKPEPRKTSLER